MTLFPALEKTGCTAVGGWKRFFPFHTCVNKKKKNFVLCLHNKTWKRNTFLFSFIFPAPLFPFKLHPSWKPCNENVLKEHFLLFVITGPLSSFILYFFIHLILFLLQIQLLCLILATHHVGWWLLELWGTLWQIQLSEPCLQREKDMPFLFFKSWTFNVFPGLVSSV